MTCSWCEEEKELTRLCNIESHRVCKECYGTYRETYPLRVEGCPYCKGNEETVVVKIHIPEVEIPTAIIHEHNDDICCEPDIVSMIVILSTFGFCLFWVYMLSTKPGI